MTADGTQVRRVITSGSKQGKKFRRGPRVSKLALAALHMQDSVTGINSVERERITRRQHRRRGARRAASRSVQAGTAGAAARAEESAKQRHRAVSRRAGAQAGRRRGRALVVVPHQRRQVGQGHQEDHGHRGDDDGSQRQRPAPVVDVGACCALDLASAPEEDHERVWWGGVEWGGGMPVKRSSADVGRRAAAGSAPLAAGHANRQGPPPPALTSAHEHRHRQQHDGDEVDEGVGALGLLLGAARGGNALGGERGRVGRPRQ